ncbi:DUF3102 domain-containing protein [Brevibacillus borstelensis]|jgi:DNA repair exonuclease SbcCD ATPase subunit|uniref:DUF3102 domain-containing protein n=1 Tax=Brevibacillus borstelensis TaxID=45462 RepID=UPI00242C0B45|nr:DUF3102 domain-containing protein [Brevibacillus borstelensis]
MSELVRSAQVIAAEIRSIDAQTREIVLRSAIEIGKRLNEAKALVPHGEWGAWLETNVNYSQSTANNFMRVAEEYKDSQTLGNLSYSQAVALLGVPAEEREQFAAEVDAENLSTRELQQAIKEKKQLEKELKKIQQAAEKDRKAREELAERVSQLQIELADAKIAGDAEQAQKLQEALAEAQVKVKQLEKELRAKPIDVPAVVEKIPEEVEKELAELRKKVAQPGNETAIKFKVQFEALGAGFRDLLATLAEIQGADPDMHEKYRGAVLGLIGKMSDTLR